MKIIRNQMNKYVKRADIGRPVPDNKSEFTHHKIRQNDFMVDTNGYFLWHKKSEAKKA